ncbi:MAG TPA: hypothetical protein VG621_00750 [Candidatus Paceibacterota bacterium]|nr:hypothetical protein [Candidatus Paceibacterota bacterium]
MNQITQESKSLWRIRNHYIGEATSDEQKAFWTKLAQEKESLIEEMKNLLKAQM